MRRIDAAQAGALFGGRIETPVRAFVQGHMGRAWQSGDGRCAQIVTGDFCFFAGDADADGARELAGHVPADHPSDSLLMLAHDAAWDARIADVWGDRARRIRRYRLHADALRADRLPPQDPPAGYRLAPLDGRLYRAALAQAWSRDFVSLFDGEADFLARGLGVAALCGDELAAAASSYLIYDGGLEIQVQTRDDHQRRGLARCCCAALIAQCLRRGLEPHWDAANGASLRLALCLGYRDGGAYDALEVPSSVNACTKSER